MGRYELNNKCVPSIEHEELKNLILLRGSFWTYFPWTHCERGARVAALRRKLTTLFRYGVVVRFLRSDVRSPRAISTKSRFRIIVKKHLKSLSARSRRLSYFRCKFGLDFTRALRVTALLRSRFVLWKTPNRSAKISSKPTKWFFGLVFGRNRDHSRGLSVVFRIQIRREKNNEREKNRSSRGGFWTTWVNLCEMIFLRLGTFFFERPRTLTETQ